MFVQIGHEEYWPLLLPFFIFGDMTEEKDGTRETPEHPTGASSRETGASSAIPMDDYEELAATPLSERISWWGVLLGFVCIGFAALLFFLHRNYPLQYRDFTINADLLGQMLLWFGLVLYGAGRIVGIIGRRSRNRGKPRV